MPRTAGLAPGGMLFHVLNRGVGRMKLFRKDADFEAFERFIEQTLETRPTRILSYCLLSNHWHFVLWPEHDGELGACLQKLVRRAESWRFCSLWRRVHGDADSRAMLSDWPLRYPRWRGSQKPRYFTGMERLSCRNSCGRSSARTQSVRS